MYSARIILDSMGPIGARLTTFELTYPRFIHAELMTHRLFSRNSASSRAIPTEKLLSRIEEDPAMPVWWGKNQSGMQAREELSETGKLEAKAAWLRARDQMLEAARKMGYGELGLHKQIVNRVVEPWMNITVIVTATELDNYWALRVDPDAQPEFQHISSMALSAYDSSRPRVLEAGEWHLPLVTGVDERELREQAIASGLSKEDVERRLCEVSVGRCARVSYLTHDGRRDPEADVDLARKLAVNGHMSPYEHVAQALTPGEWHNYGNQLTEQWVNGRIPVGNFWGWRQFRKTLAHEHDFGVIKARRAATSDGK